MMPEYLFTSTRLGFRNWVDTDSLPMAAINNDPSVMEFFPSVATYTETQAFMQRMQRQFADKGFCYYAVDTLDSSEFIGFIGISEQTFASDFTPCIDIGWRLARQHWNNGYATEGAKRCLDYAMYELNIEKINAVAPKVNIRSVQVMQKIGMQKVKEFIHPLLIHDDRLKHCVLYEVSKIQL